MGNARGSRYRRRPPLCPAEGANTRVGATSIHYRVGLPLGLSCDSIENILLVQVLPPILQPSIRVCLPRVRGRYVLTLRARTHVLLKGQILPVGQYDAYNLVTLPCSTAHLRALGLTIPLVLPLIAVGRQRVCQDSSVSLVIRASCLSWQPTTSRLWD